MSAAVRLSSKLPADYETNGLDARARALIANPDDMIVAVVWMDAQKVTHDTDSGSDVPTARIRRIEPLGDVGTVTAAVRDLVGKAFEARTGRTPIPFETYEVGEAAHSDAIDGL